jgi:two-component system NtrC family response regulator
MDRPKILVVDDEESIRTQMKWMLVEDYDVFLAKDSEAAMNIMEKEMAPLVILDLGLPPDPEGIDEGFQLLGQMLRKNSSAKIVVVTGNPDKEAPLKAIAKGAHDFFTKPINADELKAILKRASYVLNLEKELKKNINHSKRRFRIRTLLK